MDEPTRETVSDIVARGYAGTIFLTTDDCRAAYKELSARGVEFSEEPEDRPYGVDAGFRDPSGNNVRLTEVRDLNG
jgi:predicted enzyme related to lactoylglutathione lyase